MTLFMFRISAAGKIEHKTLNQVQNKENHKKEVDV
jgi:hypothetical protein